MATSQVFRSVNYFIPEIIRVTFTDVARRVGAAGALNVRLHPPFAFPSIVMVL